MPKTKPKHISRTDWILALALFKSTKIVYDIKAINTSKNGTLRGLTLEGRLEIDTDTNTTFITLDNYQRTGRWLVNPLGQILCGDMVEATKIIEQHFNPDVWTDKQ